MHSYSVRLKANLQRVDSKGTAPLTIQVIINRRVFIFPLDIKWPQKFIVGDHTIKKRKPNDQDYHDFHMIINKEIGIINEIFRQYRLRDILLTPQQFQIEYRRFDGRKDFLVFMENKITERLNNAEITPHTAHNTRSTLTSLQEYQPLILFQSLNDKWLMAYKGHLRKQGKSENTIWGRIKDIKCYLALAEADNLATNNDYRKCKTGTTTSRLVYLDKPEVAKLQAYFDREDLKQTIKESLRAFLFQCYTSLRISDVFRAEWSWVNAKGELEFVPHKNRRFNQLVYVPLSERAWKLITKRSGRFFTLPTEQEINRCLKEIAGDCNINKRLTTHVGRHTFATNYYKSCKDIIALNKVMGHAKLQQTMAYSHIDDDAKADGLRKMDEYFDF